MRAWPKIIYQYGSTRYRIRHVEINLQVLHHQAINHPFNIFHSANLPSMWSNLDHSSLSASTNTGRASSHYHLVMHSPNIFYSVFFLKSTIFAISHPRLTISIHPLRTKLNSWVNPLSHSALYTQSSNQAPFHTIFSVILTANFDKSRAKWRIVSIWPLESYPRLK